MSPLGSEDAAQQHLSMLSNGWPRPGQSPARLCASPGQPHPSRSTMELGGGGQGHRGSVWCPPAQEPARKGASPGVTTQQLGAKHTPAGPRAALALMWRAGTPSSPNLPHLPSRKALC